MRLWYKNFLVGISPRRLANLLLDSTAYSTMSNSHPKIKFNTSSGDILFLLARSSRKPPTSGETLTQILFSCFRLVNSTSLAHLPNLLNLKHSISKSILLSTTNPKLRLLPHNFFSIIFPYLLLKNNDLNYVRNYKTQNRLWAVLGSTSNFI